ncbi:hypothetical protein TREMEDRAFT_74507 [Tremella mesenterica DSM 1558]|uniref:uncharacterized protein n=1 Tax=Tremella mesenterica (strain ATCC 24925 / CBS 8224 / DSM 1558 / NBRC 9311 / NRRL Y-6157 / RJB 2259-6 / UBC 559-6) TaxID=578456 RepID=UPI0003F4964B|nr:uncharacterized protein TREMEDRAFT_74507 [Tremella mesenterica DSM 1558]EIW67770.1 hypothetical protein TREMEDRAFT_74507 [Tremella mesenterica DSM 1558]
MSLSQSTSIVLAALQALYHDPDAAAKKKANEWLQEFQHSVEAWQTCHDLLTSPETSLEGRLFSAQTLRAKIVYDLSQLPRIQLVPLRDSILTSLPALTSPSAPQGSRAVVLQLCLALADLAIQMPEWQDPARQMIENYGKDPGTVGVLLGFLKSLVEEAGNGKIPLNEDGKDHLANLMSTSAKQVLDVLVMYIQAPGLTPQIQSTIFDTLRSWVVGGELPAFEVATTPLFPATFEALASDQLFDSAVDVLCDLINETQEIQDNVEVIQQIIPRLIALGPQLDIHQEDGDRIRGYCRIFCEAGECYKDLIAKHPSDLLPLVQAISKCAAYPDLDIVPITFQFWYQLATTLGRQPTDPALQPILDIYSELQKIIIRHLSFPSDDEGQTSQEKEEFRYFRHRMGDTLKDCCHLLGAPTCLRVSLNLVLSALSSPSPQWQEIEAPLFSMRSMGAEVDPDDDEVLPHIMELLPRLPDHPRIRYAAILVLSRYTQWIDRHPQNLEFQLQYISSGFQMPEDEVQAAAAQAMKFMCQDCGSHLVPFLPQLHDFVTQMRDRLDQADMLEVCEAIGHVIERMEPEQAAGVLQQFCQPLLARVQVVAMTTESVGKPELTKAAEQIDAFLNVVGTLTPLPQSCLSTPTAVYAVLDALLARHAQIYYISERTGYVLRRGLTFFPTTALEPVLQPMLERMTLAFEQSGYPSYVWIVGKSAAKFANAARGSSPHALGVADLLGGALERVTLQVGKMLTSKTAVEIPDVIEDYLHCFLSYLNFLPPLTLSSPILHLSLSHTLSALTCPSTPIISVALDVLSILSENQHEPQLPPIFRQYGKALLGLCLTGLLQDFPEGSTNAVQSVVNAVCAASENAEVESWATEAVGGVAGWMLPLSDKEVFLRDLHEYLLQGKTGDKLKNAIVQMLRASRRAKERGRQARKSLGG